MRKSKILATVVSSALVASVAATAAISVSAIKAEDMSSHKVGIVGSFNDWSKDGEVWMTENNGVWEGTVDIPEVTDTMVVDATTDDGSGGQIPRGIKGITFKVRLDGDWGDSWGDYEAAYDRTLNSQTNCCVEAKAGTHVKINVKLDTTKNSPEALANSDSDAKEDDVDSNWWPVTYTVEEVKDEAPAESKPAEASKPAATKPATTTPAATTTTTEDTASPATGDTTSAVALVAVVLASLGTAVVMTKKASKE